MYRRKLMMAKGKGEVDPRKGLRSNFVERVVKLPMVHVAWDYAANTYSTIKESNRLVNFTLTNAERSVNFVAGQAKPVVMKFEKQIQVVDDLACKGLGTLEEKVPLITKRPEQIIGDTRKLYTNTVYSRLEEFRKYGEDKVKRITEYGLQTATTILGANTVNSMVSTVAMALDTTEKYVDIVLPPAEEEHHNDVVQKVEPQKLVYERIFHITTTIRRRIYRMTLIKLRRIKEGSNLIYNVPDYVFSFAFESIEAASLYLQSLWEAINNEQSNEKEQNIPMKQLLPVIRPVLKRLIVLYNSYASSQTQDKSKMSNGPANDVKVSPSHKGNFVMERVQWVLGILKNAPLGRDLPMYILHFIPLFGGKKTSRESNRDDASNGETSNSKHEQNHVHLSDGMAHHLD